MELEDGTKIDVIGLTARVSAELTNNKKLSDFDRGIHITAAKILVNGQRVVYDDLLDSFTDEEIVKIVEFVSGGKEGDGDEKNGQ